MSDRQPCKEGNARVSAADRVRDEGQARAQTGVEGQGWDRTGSQNAPPAPTRATTKASARARARASARARAGAGAGAKANAKAKAKANANAKAKAKAEAKASAEVQSEPNDRWRRLTITKRWVAVAGVLCFLNVAVVGIFFERIFRYLPVTSANLCAYQLAGLIRHDADRSDVRDLVARWKRICPDILVALVANENGQVVVASEAVLEGKDIPTSCLENRKALKLWISQVAPGAGLHSDRIYHIGSAEARSAARGTSYRIWVVCPPVLCTSWVAGAIMITHAPNAEWGLWSLIWWLSVPTWMYLDRVVATRKADRSAVLWALAGLLGNGLALLVYVAAFHPRRCAIGKASDGSRR